MAKSKKKDPHSGLYKVSQSKVNTYRLCRAKFDYKEQQLLRRKAKSRPLTFGGIIHSMVEEHAEGRDAFKKLEQLAKTNERLFKEEREMYGEIVADTTYIMDAYFEYWRKDPIKFMKIDGKKTEQLIVTELVDGILFKGKMDGAAEYKKLKLLVEHKSHKNIPNDDHRWRNVQSNIYIPMIERAFGVRLEGTLWDYVRSKPPTRPQILKDGSLSSRALDSLPQVVVDVIKENKLKTADYKKLIKEQEDNQKNWFQRTVTPVKPKVMKNIVDDFITTAREMADSVPIKPVRSIGLHCSWCDYEPLCRARFQGNDEDFIKEREYVVGEPDDHYNDGKENDDG